MAKERSNAAVIVIGSVPANAERRKGAWSKEKACGKGMTKDGRSNAAVIVIGSAPANAERKGHSAKKRLAVRAWQKTGSAACMTGLAAVCPQRKKR